MICFGLFVNLFYFAKKKKKNQHAEIVSVIMCNYGICLAKFAGHEKFKICPNIKKIIRVKDFGSELIQYFQVS